MPADKSVLELRSTLIRIIRGFFHERDFIEVETPVRVGEPAPELHIEAEPSGTAWLRTSPELHMKRLLADGHRKIFQIGPCFRMGERGRLHSPEYCMLEWYRAGAQYLDLIADTKALIARVFQRLKNTTLISYAGTEIELMPIWDCMSVSEAFKAAAGWDPVTSFDPDRFDMDLVNKVEPFLPRDKPLVLKDYPVETASLARCRRDTPPVAERWELYIGGMELANAFSELTDPAEQRERFEQWNRARVEAGREPYPLDEQFLSALEQGMPECAGIALGVDRLVMLASGALSIEEVQAFQI